MGIQAMILALKNNKRNRRTAFDKKGANLSSSFGELTDHKKMKTYEFAAFQKKVFQKKALEKRKRFKIIIITIIVVFLIGMSLPFILEIIFDPAFHQ